MASEHDAGPVRDIFDQRFAILRRLKYLDGEGIGLIGYVECDYLTLAVTGVTDLQGKYAAPHGDITVLNGHALERHGLRLNPAAEYHLGIRQGYRQVVILLLRLLALGRGFLGYLDIHVFALHLDILRRVDGDRRFARIYADLHPFIKGLVDKSLEKFGGFGVGKQLSAVGDGQRNRPVGKTELRRVKEAVGGGDILFDSSDEQRGAVLRQLKPCIDGAEGHFPYPEVFAHGLLRVQNEPVRYQAVKLHRRRQRERPVVKSNTQYLAARESFTQLAIQAGSYEIQNIVVSHHILRK